MSGGAAPIIPFFTDNDVANAVGDFLRDSGHQVTRLRDVMANTSADEVVAEACRQGGQVLVSHNVKDFKRIVKSRQLHSGQADRLCRIELNCQQIRACDRMREALSLIEWEWNRLGPTPQGLRISIGDNVIRIHR